MNDKQPVVVGVDMGATHIRICILSLKNEVLVTSREKTDNVILAGLVDGIANFIHTYVGARSPISAIVMGLPALVGKDKKTVISTPNLPCHKNDIEGLAERLENVLRCPVLFERDVNLQLFYDVNEFNLVNKLVLGCYLGTGFGFSIWMNGMPFTGAHGVAGELGHIPYGNNSRHCGCGNAGCLETICSGVALRRWYEKESREYALSDLFIHAQDDDDIIQFIDDGAKAIATGINLFDPDAVVLGGGVIDMTAFPLDMLIQHIQRYIRKPLPFETVRFLKASSSAFNGAIGAARLGLKDIPVISQVAGALVAPSHPNHLP
ncbi:allose kinase [Prodigiosinella confusarubida]|uniref:Allose kinase n=1 Tax=Serratia sp. (strain ATCC 39006) TaxID=104623 RepID=A0A2I5T6M6_SERS3|nr:allose kinase [Serratia sp. ATCC 39006]AUH00241.1 allose kinase [Serratia sp. ATCC 39006]AUH04561.1 allose kinase [Serratia sp. ATCC 39006]